RAFNVYQTLLKLLVECMAVLSMVKSGTLRPPTRDHLDHRQPPAECDGALSRACRPFGGREPYCRMLCSIRLPAPAQKSSPPRCAQKSFVEHPLAAVWASPRRDMLLAVALPMIFLEGLVY